MSPELKSMLLAGRGAADPRVLDALGELGIIPSDDTTTSEGDPSE